MKTLTISKEIYILFLFFLTISVSSQKHFQGKLVDAQTMLPIDNVNIFYGNSGIGTVSNKEGAFELRIPKYVPKQKINFTHINYKKWSVYDTTTKKIYLEPAVFELEEVVLGSIYNIQKELVQSLEKFRPKTTFHEKFFYKEFLKENGNYINYVEALGICTVSSKGVRDVYVRAKRQTEDKSVGFVQFRSNIHNLFKKIDLVRKSEVLKRVLINQTTYKITLKSLENNIVYEVYAEKGSYHILRITANTINDQMKLVSSSQRGYYAGKFITADIYKQGSSTEIDFKMVEGKRFINKIIYKVKLCLQTKDKSLKLTYNWDRFYLNTGFFDQVVNFNDYTRLTERDNFFDKNIINNIIDWDAENRVLPIESELEALNVLNW